MPKQPLRPMQLFSFSYRMMSSIQNYVEVFQSITEQFFGAGETYFSVGKGQFSPGSEMTSSRVLQASQTPNIRKQSSIGIASSPLRSGFFLPNPHFSGLYFWLEYVLLLQILNPSTPWHALLFCLCFAFMLVALMVMLIIHRF